MPVNLVEPLWLGLRAIRDYLHADCHPIARLEDAVKAFQYAIDTASNTSALLTAMIGLSHAYGYLADIDGASTVEHAQKAVITAESALTQFQKIRMEDVQMKARIYDALGCALRRRYIALNDIDDCGQALFSHQESEKYTPVRAHRSLKASWNHHHVTSIYTCWRGFGVLPYNTPMISFALKLAYDMNDFAVVPNSIYIATDMSLWSYFLKAAVAQRGDEFPERIEWDSIVGCGYKVLSIIGNTKHKKTAALLGKFCYMLQCMRRPEQAEDFNQICDNLFKTVLGVPFQIDLRHATYMCDILESLIWCKEELRLCVPGLIEHIGNIVDALLPRTHFERHKLHSMLAQLILADQLQLKDLGFRQLNLLPAIEQCRMALQLIPDGHPNQPPYLTRLVLALVLSTSPGQLSSFDNEVIRREATCWSGALEVLSDGVHTLPPGFSEGMLRLMNVADKNPQTCGPDEVVEVNEFMDQTFSLLGKPGSLGSHREALDYWVRKADVKLSAAYYLLAYPEKALVWRGYAKDSLAIWSSLRNSGGLDTSTASIVDFGLGSAIAIEGIYELGVARNHEAACWLLSDAIACMERSIACTNSSHETKLWVKRVTYLAMAYTSRHMAKHKFYKSNEDQETAVHLYRSAVAAMVSTSASHTDLYEVSNRWVYCAVETKHISALEAYSVLVHSVSQKAWVGRDIQTRYEGLKQTDASLIADAAVCACTYENLSQAIHFLEAGRAIIFTQALPLRSRHVELAASHLELVLELERLGAAIEERSFRSHNDMLQGLHHSFARSSDWENRRACELRCLGQKWDELVAYIRTLEGYDHFLATPPLETLCQAAANGPVVFIITSSTHARSFAIIILGPSIDAIRLVGLPLNAVLARKLSQDFHLSLSRKLHKFPPPEGGKAIGRGFVRDAPPPENAAHGVLFQLWFLVMRPILEIVKPNGIDQYSATPHIWINVVGELSSLPLHAAGVYRSDGTVVDSQSVLDHVACSYTPSLSALLRQPAPDQSRSKVCAFSGGEGLWNTSRETQFVESICSRKATVDLFDCRRATGQEIRAALREANIAHFACHGVQDPKNPLMSRLSFSKTCQVRLEELMQDVLPNASLVVLLACETAQGDQYLAEESLHIAATMLFAGFRGAVGSLWEMGDADGPKICSDFYETLLEGSGDLIEYKNAGRALHKAVCNLRDSGVGVFRWATFIHIGQ
ncbi:hypothetical protein FRC07_003414 [Ceratobasidium sp. 392]|nr:hypothetical protein FRC07_003414 [Ceratobasidium sp. 392]